MLNQVMLVGRIYSILDKTPFNGSVKICLKVVRNIKDKEDYITVELSENLATNTLEHRKIGDLIGVKGTLQCEDIYDTVVVHADKITFLSTSKGGE